MLYPGEVYNINENITRENMRKYDERCQKWYAVAEMLYPDYFEKNLKERMALEDSINKFAGFTRD